MDTDLHKRLEEAAVQDCKDYGNGVVNGRDVTAFIHGGEWIFKEARQVFVGKACEWLEKYMDAVLVWHKVSEELPKETCECLICWETIKHKRKWTQVAMYCVNCNTGEGRFEDEDGYLKEPDYWIPIPELPKED